MAVHHNDAVTPASEKHKQNIRLSVANSIHLRVLRLMIGEESEAL